MSYTITDTMSKFLSLLTICLRFLQQAWSFVKLLKKNPTTKWNKLLISTKATYDDLKLIRESLEADRVCILAVHNGGNEPKLHTITYRSVLLESIKDISTKRMKEVLHKKPLDEYALTNVIRLIANKVLNLSITELSPDELILWQDYGISNRMLCEVLVKDEFYIYVAIDNPTKEGDITKALGDIRIKLR